MSLFLSMLCLRQISDSYTCYKVFKQSVINEFNVTSRGFELEAELTVKTLMSNARFTELPINYNPRLVTEGKKINWRDMVKGLVTGCKTRFSLSVQIRN